MKKNNIINKYTKNGYLIQKNLIEKNRLHLIISSIKSLLLKYIKKTVRKNKSIDEQLIYLRKINKSKFGILFDSLQTLAINYKILTSTKVLNKIASLLNVDVASITLTDVALRLDPPIDQKNSLGWHQDSSYFRQNDKGLNGAVLWTPVTYITEEMGWLEFLKDSHKMGSLKIKRNKSSKRVINNKKMKNFKKILKCDLKLGDALLMNMDMVHRSGKNNSNKFRISLIGRYHNMSSSDFNSGLNVYKYTNQKINKETHG
jgi:ectoine hydroxylase-related dioxygenase (phytanoyl-CoA dioxygenase family)